MNGRRSIGGCGGSGDGGVWKCDDMRGGEGDAGLLIEGVIWGGGGRERKERPEGSADTGVFGEMGGGVGIDSGVGSISSG